MIFIPAIDIQDGQCVRLLRGDYTTAQKVAQDAAETAHSFRKAGAQWLHVVDLDGAKDARPKNSELIFRIQEAFDAQVEVGGGIRSMKTVDFYLQNGISRVILGTAAVSQPGFAAEAVQKYGDRIAVGLDARNGKIAQNGWIEMTDLSYLQVAKQMEQIGVKYLILTDISRDGTLTGPNLKMIENLSREVTCGITASGGISSLDDIRSLCRLNLYGAVCGKAIYSGTVDAKRAVELCKENSEDDKA